MPVEVNPKETSRASAYELWMQAPNPMVTFFKTMDVTELIRMSRKRKLRSDCRRGMNLFRSIGGRERIRRCCFGFFGYLGSGMRDGIGKRNFMEERN